MGSVFRLYSDLGYGAVHKFGMRASNVAASQTRSAIHPHIGDAAFRPRAGQISPVEKTAGTPCTISPSSKTTLKARLSLPENTSFRRGKHRIRTCQCVRKESQWALPFFISTGDFVWGALCGCRSWEAYTKFISEMRWPAPANLSMMKRV